MPVATPEATAEPRGKALGVGAWSRRPRRAAGTHSVVTALPV